jgi:transcriptional regulator with XRE-family HTH domain
MSLGKKLKLLRKEKRWSQDDLADHAGIDGRQISRYENDRVVPSVEVVVKIAKAYDVARLLAPRQARPPAPTRTAQPTR